MLFMPTELEHSQKGRKRVTELFLVMMIFALPPTKSHKIYLFIIYFIIFATHNELQAE